jgi:hypothetical protein
MAARTVRLGLIAWIVAGFALLAAFLFFAFFDVSVSTPSGGRVVNLGLLSDRQNGLILCGLVAVVSALAALALGPRRARLGAVIAWLALACVAALAVLTVAVGGSPIDLWVWLVVHL